MDSSSHRNRDDLLNSEQASFLRYEGEDDQAYILSDRRGAILRVLKNRNPPPAPEGRAFTPAFSLLAAAFIGLAPAGLGTLLFAPLALLWTVGVALFRRPGRTGWIRIAVVWAAAALMLLAAVPLALEFLSRIR